MSVRRFPFWIRFVASCSLAIGGATGSYMELVSVPARSALFAQEIDYVESFALSDDRATVLRQLVPGTDEYYFYNSLVLQQAGRLDDVGPILNQWEGRHGQTQRWRQIKYRQVLLSYSRDPQASLEELRRMIGVEFNHQRAPESNRPDLPTTLDQNQISFGAYLSRAYQGTNSTDAVAPTGLDVILSEQFDSPERRRSALSRLTHPDYPGLAELVIDDLRVPDYGSFGVLPIHARLTRAQLDRCLELMPNLTENSAFVDAYLTKLWPGADVDPSRDQEEQLAYLERLWAFVEPLPPVHNSLKANVLFQRLSFDFKRGEMNKERFLTYLKLPRPLGYMLPEYLQQRDFVNVQCDLNRDFSGSTRLPVIGNDESLVRSYLDYFLLQADGIEEFSPYVRSEYLNSRLAEVKILAGQGDQERWATLLGPEAFKALRERIDLEFAATNQEVFKPGEEVSLELDVKNVETLIVKIFEINSRNFYEQTGTEVNTDISLDGLVANHERVIKYDDSPLRRNRRTFEFPEIDHPGVYVIDFIGNGRSSRALVRIGRLHHTVRNSSAGQVVTIYNDNDERLTDAVLWMQGKDYTANEAGEIAIPFSTTPGTVPIVLRHGQIATLERLDHQAEGYALTAGIHVDRESLLRGRQATIVVRPQLTVSGETVPPGLLENPKLTIVATDLDGISTTKEIQPFELHAVEESLATIQVPPRLVALNVTLSGTIKNLSQGTEIPLATSRAFSINAIDSAVAVDAVHLSRTPAGWFFDVLGKTGEPRVDRPLTVVIKHRDFHNPHAVTLKSNELGRVELGALEGVEWISAANAEGVTQQWSLPRDQATGYSIWHGVVGETVAVPYTGSSEVPVRTELAILERNAAGYVADRFDMLRIEDGLVKVDDLPAGDYELVLKQEQRSILIRVTAGRRDGDIAIGSTRKLEIRSQGGVSIAGTEVVEGKLRIRVANASEGTRVHVFATRYRPAFDAFASFASVADHEPFWMSRPGVMNAYQSGREIGDEYQYILDRKYATRFPGVMLERPSVLLNPWAVRSTETGTQEAADGTEFGTDPAPAASDFAMPTDTTWDVGASGSTDYANLDFLAQLSSLILNARVKDGVAEIEIPEGLEKHWFTIVANSEASSASRTMVLPEPEITRLDLRLAESLNAEQAFTQRRQAEVLNTGDSREFALGSSRFQSYDSIASAYSLLMTLSGNGELFSFSFIVNWPELSIEEKRAKYSEFSCHELNVFLYHRDREFFDAVVKPYIANKKQKTFVDQWLLEMDLTEYRHPWRYAQLNTFERVLLSKRNAEELAETRRMVLQQLELQPIAREEFDRLFQVAVQGFGMDPSAVWSDGGDQLGYFWSMQRAGDDSRANAAYLMGGMGGGGMGGMPGSAPGMPQMEALAELQLGSEVALADGEADASNGIPLLRQRDANQLMDEARRVDRYSLAIAEKDRKAVEQLFRQVDTTQEWAENQYYHVPLDQLTADRISVNRFWSDFVKHEGDSGFMSPHIAEATDNLSEMLLALAVLDLPFKAAEHETKVEGDTVTLTAAGPMIVFHEQIRPALEADENASPILVSQNYFQANDRYRYDNGEQADKFVTEEFVIHTVYGCQIAVTNPTSSRRKLDLLVQIPQGAISVQGGKATRSMPITLEPFATQTVETYFYFPLAGEFEVYPVQISQAEQKVTSAEPIHFHVVEQATVIDRTSWDWVSQYGENAEILAYLENNNPLRLDLSRIAFRLQEKEFYEQAIAVLKRRHLFEPTLWSYSIKHGDDEAIREYLQFRDDVVGTVGASLESPLLSVDPQLRRWYEHLDYKPLVNARAHQLGPNRRILNNRFHAQYHSLMSILALKPELNADDQLAITYYLLLQDRYEEALERFELVDRDSVSTPMQYDLFDAWLDLVKSDPTSARETAAKYLEYPVDRWRESFAAIVAQCDEIAGANVAVIDDEDRTQQQTAAADATPSYDFKVESQKIALSYRNLSSVTINFYRMDIELLFSRDPFVQNFAGRFSFIRPNESMTVELAGDATSRSIELPESLRSSNVLVEIVAAGEVKSQAYYAHSLDVQLQDEFGQLQVRHAETSRALPLTYVKVYARMNDGTVKFYKDGYTDLRGRFDYASLSTNDLDNVERFSILLMHDEHGALVREAVPPKR